MSIVRPFAPADLDRVYAISLATGDSGVDAGPLHKDGKLVGHIYSAPYALLVPELAFVAEDDHGVAGYVVGTTDTRTFEARLEREWWPALRAQYADPSNVPEDEWDADQKRIAAIHYPHLVPDDVAGPFPAHMHMNLLTRLQGAGMGGKLFARWAEAARSLGVEGVHVGVSPTNPRGRGFWESRGFRHIETRDGGVWLGQRL